MLVIPAVEAASTPSPIREPAVCEMALLAVLPAAMACTVAVEEAIDEHYQEQENTLPEGELKEVVKKFRQEELEHRDAGLEHGAADMKGYELFHGLVKTGCKAAIFLAKRF